MVERLKNWRYVAGWIVALAVAVVNWGFASIIAGPVIGAAAVVVVALLYLSPLGAWYQARTMGARRASPEEAEWIMAVLQPLLERSGRPGWRPRLWIVETPAINAWAYGLSDILVTAGLLEAADPVVLQGVLAHEVGHLVRHHTLISVIARGAMTVGAVATMILSFFLSLVDIFLSAAFNVVERDEYGRERPAQGWGTLISWLFRGMQWLSNWISSLVLLALGRLYEYEADATAVELGAGEGLLSFLTWANEHEEPMPPGLLAAYTATHPPTARRIQRVQELLASRQSA